MALSSGLTGAAAGVVAGLAASGALWQAGQGAARPWAGAAGLLIGAAAGLVAARRRRWGDGEVALYLDGRLGSGEVLATALEVERTPGSGAASEVVVARAAEVLRGADPKRARPPLLRPWHGAIPLAAAAIVYVTLLPLPRGTAAPPPPGVDKVQLAEVKGIEKVAKLGSLQTPDPEQKRRLEKIARDAAELREKLKGGVERREALAEIARLQDAVQQERLSLGDGERKQGLEAALARLAQDPLTRDAAKALGDRDLVKLDDEMQKLANEREKADRERARKALEEAAEAARKAGAEDVARALERQRELLEQRGARADELRELGEALKGSLSEEDRKELEGLGAPKSDKDARKLARSMQDALKKLSPEERKRLAENLKKRVARGGMSPQGEQRMRDLARELTTEEGQKKLEEELRKLANEPTEDEGAEQQEELDDAQRGLGQAQGELGMPIPVPTPGQGQGQGDKGQGQGEKGQGEGKGQGKGQGDGKDGPGQGGSEDTGTGDHKGQSKDVGADDLRARARARLDGKAPSAGISIGRTAGRAGETANVRGSGAIGQVGPAEVNGVDKSEVPEEYREQVGRYFQPLPPGRVLLPRAVRT